MKQLITSAVMAIVLMVGLLTSPPSHASIEDKLNESFDAMANYTPPSVYMGNRRGVISGGSLSIRTPNVNIKPFSLRGPSITMGCGGIDAFFGSFSFISKEQLVQAMRAIVTAAITYAFQLALEAMCPTCADILKEVQSWLQKANEFLTNSCEATRNFMDDQGIKTSIQRTAKSWRCSSGAADDCGDAEQRGKSEAPEDTAQKENPKVYQELPAKGNQVWNILQKTGDSAFGFSANDFFEEIMSMTGTVIACIPEDGGCAEVGKPDGTQPHVGQNGELSVWRKPPIMTLSALVEGGAAGNIKKYSCETASKGKECEKITVTSDAMRGMANRVRDAFIGDGVNTGIIFKARYHWTTAPDSEEEKWMKLGGSVTGMALRLTARDPDAARGFVDDNAEAMAAEIIITFLDKYMMSTKVALGRSNQDGLKEAYELIQRASERAHDDAKKYFEESQSKAQLYSSYLTRLDPALSH